MKKLTIYIALQLVAIASLASSIGVLPTLSPAGGEYEDQVQVTCTMPLGCSGLKYWINGAELTASVYDGPITIERSCRLSVAGVNSEGRIITDVASENYTIHKVTPPWITVTPAEGIRQESFYVTKIHWNNVVYATLDLSDYQKDGAHYGEPAIWVTNAQNKIVAFNDYNGLWADGANTFKAYIYSNYKIDIIGQYILHVAAGVFVLDGKRYTEELQLHYEVAAESAAPVITPASGTYVAPLTVTIDYPTDGSAFNKIYKINGGKRLSYNGPITLTESATIEAWGVNESFTANTDTAKVTYTLTEPAPVPEKPAKPVLTRTGNSVSISAEKGTIRYWFNDRLNSAQDYTAPITVTENTKISCIAYTIEAYSEEAVLLITDLPKDRGDKGEQLILTPENIETLHIMHVSPNGRFATGYTGEGSYSTGFIWDIFADKMQFPTKDYVNQLLAISDDGVAYGWRLTTREATEQVTDDDIFWGICQDGIWQKKPREMSVQTISEDGLLLGEKNGLPVSYSYANDSYTTYTGKGALMVRSAAADIMGGYSEVSGKKVATIWAGTSISETYPMAEAVTAISENGEWAVLDGGRYRLHVRTGEVSEMTSPYDASHVAHMPERIYCIANDGTCFGTYDESLTGMGENVALVYTMDNRWRQLEDWLLDERNYHIEDYSLRSVRGITGDASEIVTHAFPRGVSIDDAFTRGLAIRLDVQVKNLAPKYIQAAQMTGAQIIKIEWEEPLTGAEDVTGYRLYRNNTLLYEAAASERSYYDKEVENGNTYVYTITAVYAEKESEPSYSVSVNCEMQNHRPVRSLTLREVGYNSLNINWKMPIISIPKLQYFNENAETSAFGSLYDSEWAIRIPAADLHIYQGEKIRTFQFLPTGRQLGYEIRFYYANSVSGAVDAEPFYRQKVSPEDWTYGTMNYIRLTTPQDVPADKDLIVSIWIHSAGNFDMFGLQFDGFRAGYTDLARIDGVYSTFVTMSEMEASAQVVLPVGIGICTEEQIDAALVKTYIILNGETELTRTTNNEMLLTNVPEGHYRFGVQAQYMDDVLSEPVFCEYDFQVNEHALAVNHINIAVDEKQNVELSWQAPKDDDAKSIHWGDNQPSEGITMEEELPYYAAISIYPTDMLGFYGEDYEIYGAYFYPTGKAQFEIILDDTESEVFADVAPEQVTLNAFNYVLLDEPVAVNRSLMYRLTINLWNPAPDEAHLAFDSSNKSKDGFSNIIAAGEVALTLTDFVSSGKYPSWLMGLMIRRRDALELNIRGYNVLIDGKQQNESILTNTYFSLPLQIGAHKAQVETIYGEKHIIGEENPFVVSGAPEGIENVTTTIPSGACYDVLGRRVDAAAAEHGVYIISGTKIIK